MAGFSTTSIHGHDFFDRERGAFKVPIYQIAVYEHPDRETGTARTTDRGLELKYSREENPTVRAFERIIFKLERGADALAFNSGMAAIAAVYLSTLKSGDRVVVAKECYGTTQQLATSLSKFGVKCVLAGPETADFVEKISKETALVLLETVTNPTLRVVDVREVAKRCAEVGAPLVVDNTFATPVLYNPLVDGAWLVVHSTTKYIAGHNDAVGGAVVGRDALDVCELWDWRRRLGSIMGPFEAFLTIRGVSTLNVRFEAQSRSALALAEFLREHPKVEEVYYPGLSDSPYRSVADRLFKKKLYGGVLSFKVKGGKEEALKVLRRVKVIKPSPSLGGVESLITYPVWSSARTLAEEVRRELGITENLLRLSVGLEDVEDLKEDLSAALS